MAEEIIQEETSFSGKLDDGSVEPSTLPSDKIEDKSFIPEGFEDFVKENTSDNGKLYGQFDTVQEALEHFRQQEVTHTNKMREIKDEQKSKQEEVQSIQAELETTQAQKEALEDMIPEFIENDMQLSEDMLSKVKELGLDEKDIKLKAYEIKEQATAMKSLAFETVGGEEEYQAMMTWANDNLDETTKADFDKSIKGMVDNPSIGALAIKGLYATYKDGGTQPSTPTRIEGYSKPNDTVRGYTSQDKLFADRRASQKNPAMREQYLAKLALTDDKVLSLH